MHAVHLTMPLTETQKGDANKLLNVLLIEKHMLICSCLVLQLQSLFEGSTLNLKAATCNASSSCFAVALRKDL